MSHLSNFCGEKAHSRQQINDAPFERETSNDKHWMGYPNGDEMLFFRSRLAARFLGSVTWSLADHGNLSPSVRCGLPTIQEQSASRLRAASGCRFTQRPVLAIRQNFGCAW